MSQCFPCCAKPRIQPSITVMALINYLSLLFDRAGSERCNALKPWGWMACPDTPPHMQEDSPAQHYHILWALSQSFRHCTQLSVCHVNALSWRLMQHVAPIRIVISCKGAGQAVQRAKSAVTCPVGPHIGCIFLDMNDYDFSVFPTSLSTWEN